MSDAEKLFKERAKWIRRDLKAGYIVASEIPLSIKSDWEKDEDEWRSAYGVTSFAQFQRGILNELAQKKPTAKKAPPKTTPRARAVSSKPRKKRAGFFGKLASLFGGKKRRAK